MAFSPKDFDRNDFETGLTLGDYRFDVISADRVQRGAMHDRVFVVDIYYQGAPLPQLPRETFIFTGKVSQDVYDDTGTLVGTKEGADPRTRLPSIFFQRAEAARLGIRMGQIDDTITESIVAPIRETFRTREINTVVQELAG